ncbi:MAG: hypothetical protein ACD_62C00171G0003 [uncultured bacterium]|nr:MAG: hypothetical protein ACD_62C00171G0003 [uncultured bacterium]
MTQVQFAPNANPLTDAEFNQFEITPDGVIYLDELATKQLVDEFISRFVKTSVPSTIDLYVGGMSLSLVLKTREALLALQDNPELMSGLTDEDKKRIDHWLENEFAINGVYANFSAGYEYSTNEESGHYELVDGQNSIYEMLSAQGETSHTPWVYGSASGEHTGPLWKHNWSMGQMFAGSWSNQYQDVEYIVDDVALPQDPYREKDDTKIFKTKAGVSFERTDDKGDFSAGGYYKYYLEPMADSKQDELSAQLNGQINKIRGSGLSCEGGASFFQNQYTEPNVVDQQARSGRTFTANLEPSLQLVDRFGLVMEAQAERGDSTSYYSTDKRTDVSVSLLGQIALNKKEKAEAETAQDKPQANLRVGAGGSYQANDTERTDRPEEVITQEGDAYAEGSFSLAGPKIGLKIYTDGRLNFSYGSLVGIYPSSYQRISLTYTPKKGSLGFGVSHFGYRWTLDYIHLPGAEAYFEEGEYSKTSHAISASVDGKVAPKDFLELNASGSVGRTLQQGAWAYEYMSYAAEAGVSLRLFPSNPEVWLSVSGDYSFYDYADQYSPGTKLLGHYGGVYANLSVNQIPLARKTGE